MSSTTHKVSTPAIPLTHAVYNGMVRALRTFINFLQEKMEPTLGRFPGIDIFLSVSPWSVENCQAERAPNQGIGIGFREMCL